MDEGNNLSLDLNQDPPIVFEQVFEQENKIFNISMERTEMFETRNRLPKQELQTIISDNSIRLFEAINHLKKKNEIISEMKSLYPKDEWNFDKVVRREFFFFRQRDRECSLEDLSKMLSALKEKGYAPQVVQKDYNIE